MLHCVWGPALHSHSTVAHRAALTLSSEAKERDRRANYEYGNYYDHNVRF